jgi:3-dehydroquinate synthase
MSDLKASVVETKNGFHVEGYEKIEYDFSFLDGIFDPKNNNLASCFSTSTARTCRHISTTTTYP